MKKLLLIIGIASITVCVLFLLFAILNLSGYYNLFDGTAEHYNRLHNRMIFSFAIGTLLAAIGTVCFIIRSKI